MSDLLSNRLGPVSSLLLALLALGGPASALADDRAALIGLINDYRQMPQQCQGKAFDAAGPLQAEARLDRAQVGNGSDLLAALQATGYQPATVRVISLSGSVTLASVAKAVTERYCATALDAQYTDIGLQQAGNSWRIILARPLLQAGLPAWEDAGRAVLQAVNAARAKPQRCGTQPVDAAPALRWSDSLAQTALAHSRDMATHNYFSHTARDGSLAGQRATRAGYAWQLVGENIAAGQGSAKQVVDGWLSSPAHCFNVMNAEFSEMGAAYAVDPQSDAGIYWTQMFGTPQ
ncbi:MAG: CAP domain-containing protein [Gammaproteobacteria bacterium]|nr:CAP domain-containing protein [Gammaproteobacteria bacterium]MBU1488483.1 CAP domain-containing protein [Gammaproteobacteria bacterium]MBU2067074.1 CAP domain-containing protein [Gammaproteobacteria bacterium]MBU2138093.1 CAP domain-containing protein [Gammaproteobacteria bacterium]MBU2216070.1 CAP domain-containing protein [Gammaproteobacteria bacterium]